MTQLVTIQQAARNALATWLTTQLAPVAGGAGVAVEPRWFEASRQLPPRAISIINAGARQVEWTDPEVLCTTNNGDTQVDVIWGLAYLTQPIQLDVWMQSDVELDDVMARLDIALNAGRSAYTAVSTNVEPVGAGLLLALQDGWDPGTVDFLFEQPSILEAPSSVEEGEWRATYQGVANARLVVKATTARMATITLKQRLRTTDPVDTTQPYLEAILTASGETDTTGS